MLGPLSPPLFESGWSWGQGFGFPKILGKCFSGSPSPYKHIYNLFLLSLYEQIYYVFLNQHKSVYFNNCPLDLCLCLDLERFYVDAFML